MQLLAQRPRLEAVPQLKNRWYGNEVVQVHAKAWESLIA
jgi:hypothetical protein